MSKLLITKYHNQLHEILSAGGTRNETSITFAFANLLRSYAEKKGLLLVEQFEFVGKSGKRIRPDGVLKYFGGIDVGYWEAKDSKDNLNVEINKKLNEAGYPNKNIIFEDTQTAVLIQEGAEVMRVSMTEWNLLDDLLDKFVDYQPSEVREFTKALEQFKENVPTIVEGLRGLMEKEAETNKTFRDKRDAFLEIARSEINPEITPEDIREMIIQHILTEDIFTNVFDDAEFHRSNNIARELEDVIHTFMTREVRKNYLSRIEYFYKTIRDAASGITDNHEKQKFLKTVYENFYKVYNPKGADKLGVVYTPNEIVRFMIDSTDWLLEKHFGKSLSDKGVDILDPATGTGTFIAELIDRINIHTLEYKYENELHANEVAILPYYIANLNIEYTYQQRKGTYKEFKNICFVDTLDNTDALAYSGQQPLLGGISSENAKRIKDQNTKKISVIIGNPPYNAKQANYNFQNSNRAYKEIDRRIKDTYIKNGTAQNQIVVYDMFTRFYRWSMDRLNDNGVIAFITNRTFIDSRAFDGFRKSVQNEFDSIYIVDLRSDVRANPKIAGTSHNVFGIQTGVAIAFLVKHSEKQKDKRECKIYYIELDDFWRKEKKLEWIRENPISTIAFERIEHDAKNNWINQTDNDWDSLLPLIDKDVKAGKSEKAIFRLFSGGLKTQRDEWTYDHSKSALKDKMNYFIKIYESTRKKKTFADKMTIKWDADLESYLNRNIKKEFNQSQIIEGLYRPFVKEYLYLDKHFNGRTYQWLSIPLEANATISISGLGASQSFQALASNRIVGLDCLEKTQSLPLYYDLPNDDKERIENITDWALNQFQTHYAQKTKAETRPSGSVSSAGESTLADARVSAIEAEAETRPSGSVSNDAKDTLTNVRVSAIKAEAETRPSGSVSSAEESTLADARVSAIEAEAETRPSGSVSSVGESTLADARVSAIEAEAETRLSGNVSSAGENTLADARVSASMNSQPITKQCIFYYVYAVLHSPQYRRKYEQNLKREFPRLPFYEDFTVWRDWGERLMDLHINYETQDAFALDRKDLDLSAKRKAETRPSGSVSLFAEDVQSYKENTLADARVSAFEAKPKTRLRADKNAGTIEIDSHTTLTGIPPLAWEYKLGNRSALEWILDQYKEKKPQDATIAERFNHYKFADYKEPVIDLLKRVTNVSVKTMEIVNLMPKAD